MAFDIMNSAAAMTDPNEEDVLLLDRRGPGRAVDFLGLRFAAIDLDTLLQRLAADAAPVARFRAIVTPNVDHMVRLDREPELKPVYDSAWLLVNDSRVLQTLAGWSGLDLPAVPGSDLSARVLETIIQPDEPVVVIGGDQSVIDALKARYGLTTIQWHQPPFGLRQKPEAIAEAAGFLASHSARFHFLCVGSPQQEMIALEATRRGDVRGYGLCVGASLDFLAGKVARAPAWMRQMRLEWLFRLLQEPGRMWKRYLVEGPRIFSIWRAWQRSRSSRS